jgi:hypothetical protein
MHMPAPRALALASSVTYPGTAEHIRIVRADLRAALHQFPMAEDVILCASELAANAAIHSRSRLPGGTFTSRRTAGCRPSVTPGTARHRLAAVTPADRDPRAFSPAQAGHLYHCTASDAERHDTVKPQPPGA